MKVLELWLSSEECLLHIRVTSQASFLSLKPQLERVETGGLLVPADSSLMYRRLRERPCLEGMDGG